MHIHEILENILMAFDTLRTHKIRSALTMLGVIGGTATVIAISSFLTGLREYVLDQTKKFGPDLVYVTKYDQIGMRFSRPSQSERMRKNITVEDGRAIAELPTVDGVSPQLFVGSMSRMAAQTAVKRGGLQANRPIIFGVAASYDQLRNVSIRVGRFFTATEEDHRAQVTVIGAAIAESLFPGIDPLERELEIEGKVYRVIGVTEKQPGGLFGGDAFEDRQLLVPFETIKRDHPEIEDISLMVKARSSEFGKMVDQITELMRRRHGLTSDKPN